MAPSSLSARAEKESRALSAGVCGTLLGVPQPAASRAVMSKSSAVQLTGLIILVSIGILTWAYLTLEEGADKWWDL